MLRSVSMPPILMVSTEYPPMQGGVGRYTLNLTKKAFAKSSALKSM